MSRMSFFGGLHRVVGLFAVVATVCGAGVFGGACSVTSTNAATDAGPITPGTDASDGSSAVDGGSSPLGFTPSNVDLSGIDLSKVGDFVVDADCTINTDTNLASCGDGANVLGFKVATQSDGTKVGVYVARSMTVPAGKSLTVEGSLPLVFIALETITIGGAVDGSLSAAAGLRRASAIPARPLRRNALARVIVDLRGSTKGPPPGMDTETQSRTPEGLFQAKRGRQPSAEATGRGHTAPCIRVQGRRGTLAIRILPASAVRAYCGGGRLWGHEDPFPAGRLRVG